MAILLKKLSIYQYGLYKYLHSEICYISSATEDLSVITDNTATSCVRNGGRDCLINNTVKTMVISLPNNQLSKNPSEVSNYLTVH
jgi:hypothetical protein